MKTATVALLAVSLSVGSALAGPAFGGFKPGQKFTFKVSEKLSVKRIGLETMNNAPVPAGVPNYKVGQKVKFKIGAKGQLIARGASIPFKSDAGTSNVYTQTKQAGAKSSSDQGTVFKVVSSGTSYKATGVELSFTRNLVTGTGLASQTVSYTLD
jgi:hypothetical protein